MRIEPPPPKTYIGIHVANGSLGRPICELNQTTLHLPLSFRQSIGTIGDILNPPPSPTYSFPEKETCPPGPPTIFLWPGLVGAKAE